MSKHVGQPWVFVLSRDGRPMGLAHPAVIRMWRRKGMRRADRDFELFHLLRRSRRAITPAQLAETLEVAPRTIDRDIAALMAMRVPIDGAAGVGSIMRPGYDLPPLMFDREEVEAIAVGLQLLTRTGDQDLQVAARRVVSRIAGVLPELRAHELDDGRFLVSGLGAPTAADMGVMRCAVRDRRRLAIVYRDEQEQLGSHAARGGARLRFGLRAGPAQADRDTAHSVACVARGSGPEMGRDREPQLRGALADRAQPARTFAAARLAGPGLRLRGCVQDRAAARHSAIRPIPSKFKVVATTSAVDARDNTETTTPRPAARTPRATLSFARRSASDARTAGASAVPAMDAALGLPAPASGAAHTSLGPGSRAARTRRFPDRRSGARQRLSGTTLPTRVAFGFLTTGSRSTPAW